MQTIITPTDFSPASRNACSYAAKTAQAVHANLLLVHVVEAPVAITEFSEIVDITETRGIKDQLQELLDELCVEINNEVNIEATIISGNIEHELKALCSNEKPFAVIMATHSNSYIERFFMGSTTAYMSQHLRFPVIVVPSITTYAPVKKIALATDLKNTDEMPAREIETIIRSFNADLEIFHVSKDRMTNNSIVLNLFTQLLPDIHHRFYSTQNEDIPAAISSLNRTHDIDMLMVLRKNHGLFHKSQSNDFIFNAYIPTMVLHTDDVMEKV